MKGYLIILLTLGMGISLYGQAQKNVSAEIKNVVLFPDRAQITHEATVSFSPGESIAKIGGLSPYIDVTSVQIKGEGDFTILAVNSQMNFLENPEEDPEVDDLRKQISSLVVKIEDERTAIDILREKETFLTANRILTGNDRNLTAEQFKSLTDLYVSGIESTRTGILKMSRKIKELESQKQKLENQISGIINKSAMPIGEVLISVSSPRQVNGKLTLSYLVTNAGWYPSYDIRVEEVDAPASIFYKANAWQNSGSDWKNVKISFSNASPSASGNLPVLYPYYLNYYQPIAASLKGRVSGVASKASQRAEAVEEIAYTDADKEYFEPPSRELTVAVTDATTSFSFDVGVPQTVNSDGKISLIELQRLTVEADYKYKTVPKIREEAFLTADISDWESLNLLDGEANIYFGNTFTGKTYLSTSQLSDTLNISLGKDNSITLKREKRKDFTTTRLIGVNRQETRSFLISVRNNKSKEIAITVYDQLPVSQNNNITVEPEELSGGKLDKVTGEVKWELKLGAGESRELLFTYTVKYPRDKRVILE
ncbi:MAG TPA: DUF4139 domain-containing protein [Bacteroidales bacterium]|nr:DUF4139 domain-containing protein [Bacteroidales bacterium]